jgi:hypothetical protein
MASADSHRPTNQGPVAPSLGGDARVTFGRGDPLGAVATGGGRGAGG